MHRTAGAGTGWRLHVHWIVVGLHPVWFSAQDARPVAASDEFPEVRRSGLT
ncbi:MAG TPA: hypothetical protein VER97_09645 [Geodermatophilus sp.]|nr:hypothetical protein [Geodermatophilus sp.]